jgi:hypothetical protein
MWIKPSHLSYTYAETSYDKVYTAPLASSLRPKLHFIIYFAIMQNNRQSASPTM